MVQKMQIIKKDYVVQKRNALNELRAKTISMTLQELRLFSIYLARINKNKPKETRVVRFPIEEFQAIMELESRIKIDHMEDVTTRLLQKVVNVPLENGGYTAFQLFKECTVSEDDNGGWYVEIDAHDKALPLMFDYQDKFFSYKLWNALKLRSVNQLRMYEILKQYEKVGERILAVDDLKELLGMEKNEYERFGNFEKDVLEVCRKALQESTDIKFTYEPHGKKGKSGKIHHLKFIIEKNEDYIDQLPLFEYVDKTKVLEAGTEPESELDDNVNENVNSEVSPAYTDKINFLAEACNNEFSYQEIVVLFNDIRNLLPHSLLKDDVQLYDYLSGKYQEMLMQNQRAEITHRFSYLRKMLGNEYR
jgi:plasmid replication initiation protein